MKERLTACETSSAFLCATLSVHGNGLDILADCIRRSVFVAVKAVGRFEHARQSAVELCEQPEGPGKLKQSAKLSVSNRSAQEYRGHEESHLVVCAVVKTGKSKWADQGEETYGLDLSRRPSVWYSFVYSSSFYH